MEEVKVRKVEMKHLIEAACDGAKGSSGPVASVQEFDSTSELWLEYLERFRTFLTEWKKLNYLMIVDYYCRFIEIA